MGDHIKVNIVSEDNLKCPGFPVILLEPLGPLVYDVHLIDSKPTEDTSTALLVDIKQSCAQLTAGCGSDALGVRQGTLESRSGFAVAE